MGGAEVNVAYHGDTSADFGANDALLFDAVAFEELLNSTDSLSSGQGFTAINDGTVSPQDLFNDSNASVPPSTAFTNLTTPGSALLDTPDDAYETSPMFGDGLGTDAIGDNWFSLFPDSDKTAAHAPVMSRTISSNSATQVLIHPGGESRKRSATAASPLTATSRPSSTAGVHKREKVLPPILVDENDHVAMKRARNTAAARKSRDKKVKERDLLEQRINDLESEVEHWKAIALAQNPALGS